MFRKSLQAPNLMVFDLDNTLYEYHNCNRAGLEAFANFASETLGMSSRNAMKLFKQARHTVKNRISGASSHDRALYFAEFLAIHGKVNDPRFILEAESLYWTSFISQMKLAPYCHELIIKARAKGILIALVTDLSSVIQYKKLIYLGLENAFDVIVTSQETKGEKESFEPFALLLQRLDRDFEVKEVWFIGDSKVDFPHSYPAASKHYFLSPFADRYLRQRNFIALRDYKQLIYFLD